MRKINLLETIKFINSQSPETRIYLGADSARLMQDNRWIAEYTVAVVVHINGSNGCKVFGEVTRDLDYDKHLNKPSLRLMTEVYKVSEMYHKLYPYIAHDIEVHLDINPSDKYASNRVIQQAIGYIKGTCNTIPKVKPDAWAASSAADKLTHILAA